MSRCCVPSLTERTIRSQPTCSDRATHFTAIGTLPGSNRKFRPWFYLSATPGSHEFDLMLKDALEPSAPPPSLLTYSSSSTHPAQPPNHHPNPPLAPHPPHPPPSAPLALVRTLSQVPSALVPPPVPPPRVAPFRTLELFCGAGDISYYLANDHYCKVCRLVSSSRWLLLCDTPLNSLRLPALAPPCYSACSHCAHPLC